MRASRRDRTKSSSPWGLWLVALGYGLALVSLSLFPFSGWQDAPGSPWAFLFEDLPRYRTQFDIWSNLLAYIPMGLVWASLFGRLKQNEQQGSKGSKAGPVLKAAVLCVVLSFLMECLQTYLPTRRAQWLDLLTNSLGGLAGALLWALGRRVQSIYQRQRRPFRGVICMTPLPGGWPVGLGLMGLWLLAQATGQSPWLAMSRNSLAALGLSTELLHLSPGSVATIAMEAGLTASHLVCLALLLRLTLSGLGSAWANRLQAQWSMVLGLTLFAAVLIRGLWIWQLSPGASADSVLLLIALHGWLSPGVQTGLFLAGLLGAAAFALEARGLAKLGVVLICLALGLSASLGSAEGSATLVGWGARHWSNLQGLAYFCFEVWPLAFLMWMLMIASQQSPQSLGRRRTP
ncbi:MAG: VanZ family protein [Burkholderiaceae bacterium]|jgi:VanZ family protein